jgi:hypothetical protein
LTAVTVRLRSDFETDSVLDLPADAALPMTLAEVGRVVLHEGKDVQAFSGETVLNTLRVTPYDAFAMFLYHERKRLGPEKRVT